MPSIITIDLSTKLSGITGSEKLPVGNNTGNAIHVTIDDIRGYALQDYSPAWSDISGIPPAVSGTTASFTTALESKLDGIESGAQINTVSSVAGKTGTVTLAKADVGLGNVDNTSDLNKPISTATQTALDAKQSTLVSGTNIKTINAQSILGSGDIAIGISATWGSITGTLSAQTDLQSALDSKANTTHSHAISDVTGLSDALAAKLEAGAIASFETTTQLNSRDTANRDRANHTGTQTASTISDFQTTVSANTDVTANTAARHAAVTLAGTPNYLTIAGQAITRALIDLASHVTGRLPFANLAQGTAHSVVGRSGSGSGDVANITAGNDTILARNGSGNVDFQSVSTIKTMLALSKSDVGLGNVDNTSDLNKPISTATQTALDAKQTTLVSGTNIKSINGNSILGSGDLVISGGGSFQNKFSTKKIGYWNPPGNANTIPGVFGMTAPTVTNFTSTGRNVATTNIATRSRRLGYVTGTTAGTVGHFRTTAPQYTTGHTSGGDPAGGGFLFAIRFAISDAAAISDARMFLGMGANATPSNVDPSTLINCLGIGHNAAHTNLHIFYGGATAQTPIDLGANFPITHGTVELYELVLQAPTGVLNEVAYEVRRLGTPHVATGTLSGSGNVPNSNQLLCAPWGYRTNNGTALAAAVDICYVYIETDF